MTTFSPVWNISSNAASKAVSGGGGGVQGLSPVPDIFVDTLKRNKNAFTQIFGTFLKLFLKSPLEKIKDTPLAISSMFSTLNKDTLCRNSLTR